MTSPAMSAQVLIEARTTEYLSDNPVAIKPSPQKQELDRFDRSDWNALLGCQSMHALDQCQHVRIYFFVNMLIACTLFTDLNLLQPYIRL